MKLNFKTLAILLISTLCLSVSANTISFDVETRVPDKVCKNVKKLESLLNPYLDIEVLNCTREIISTSFLGNDDYLVKIEVNANVQKCISERNQAVSFSIPTNDYYHWNPPMRFGYIDKIVDELGLKSEISVTNLGPITKPKYKQIVIIPECAFKSAR